LGDPQKLAESILLDFDPVFNEKDRRILFEVTGMRLQSAEFRDGAESSESEGFDNDPSPPDVHEFDYAFMHRGTEDAGEETKDPDDGLLGPAIND